MIVRERVPFGAFGLVGSFVPSIIKMFNDLPNIAFVLRWEWAVVIALYGFVGALIAIIYPYRGRPTAWRALLIGCTFPALVGVASAIGRARDAGPGLGTNDPNVQWTFLDYLAIY